ncbi:hypothetical protein D3C78_808600 [compost metagenome]
MPVIEGFLVLGKNGYRQAVRIKADPLGAGKKLPRPCNGFLFEIVANRKIAQHLKKRMMSARFANILDVVGADAFLRICNPRVFRYNPTVKVCLKRRHTCIDP